MSKNLLMILVAGVDIWAALLITQISQPTRPWEASVATSDERASTPTMTVSNPIQVWLKDGQMGLWPETSHPMTLREISQHLENTVEQNPTRRMEIRLLCDQNLTIDQWGHVALSLSAHAEEIRIAPLVDPNPDSNGNPQPVD